MKRIFQSIFFLLFLTSYLIGQTTYTSTATGNWSTMTWSPAGTPGASDNVVIADGHTVTIDASPSIASLTVGQGTSGILTFDGAAIRAVTVSGDVTVAAGGTFITQSSGTSTNTLSIGGNLTNNGTFDMSRGGTTLLCDVTFNKNGSATVTGTGTTTRFNLITVNLGTSHSNILEISSSDFKAKDPFLTLTNGTLKLSGSYTLSNKIFTTTSYTIAATTGIWLNNTNITVTGQGGSPTNNGLLRITAGTYNVGTSSGNSLGASAGAQFIIEGGTLTVAGRLQTTAAITYSQSAGTVNVSNVGFSATTASFGLTSSTVTFTMSGGTINLVQANTNASPLDYSVNTSGTISITGGTLNIGTSATATNFTFKIQGAMPNTVLDNTTNNKSATLSGNATIYGTLTLNGTGTFAVGGNTLTLQNQILGTSANLTALSTASITIGGSASGINIPSSITSLSTLVLNNSNGTTLQSNLAVSSTLTLTAGDIALNGYTLTLGTTAASPGTLSTPSGFLTGQGTFTRYFNTSGLPTTFSGNVARFPMGSGTNDRIVLLKFSAATITTGGTISVSYSHLEGSTSVTSFVDSSKTIDKRSNASWTISQNGIDLGSTKVSLRINAYGIGGVNALTDLALTQGSQAAGGSHQAADGSTTNPNIYRTGLSLTDLTNTFYVGATSSSPLPVEITSFTSSIIGNKVELNWSTATEVNNYGFEIQRSAVGSRQSVWEKISFVKGSGNSNSPKKYSFTDEPIGGKEFQYRLRQIDFNGAFEYSEIITAILENASEFKLEQNYPNPFNPMTRISYTLPVRTSVKLRVYDLLAQVIVELMNGIQEAGRHEVTFDGSNLPSGAYFYKLEAGSYIEVKKLLLVK